MARVFLHISFFLLSFFNFAQENSEQSNSSMRSTSVNASGGNASSSSGSISYSIGITHYTGIESSNNLVSQGIQQSAELEPKEELEGTLAQVMAYPNPSTNYIILDIKDFNNEPTNYQIFSPNGSIMKTGTINAKSTKLPTEQWSNATYFIKISVLNKFEETLKIIKN